MLVTGDTMRQRLILLLVFAIVPLAPAWGWPYPGSFCPAAPFSDVPTGSWCPWIHGFTLDGIAAECTEGAYCPDAPLRRRSAALLIERAMRGTAQWNAALGWYAASVVVNPVPGDALASGQVLRAACAAIAAGVPGRPWLIELEPGHYDLGSSTLTLPPLVSLKGSGQAITRVSGQPPIGQAVLVLPVASSLRDLSVTATAVDRPAIQVADGGVNQPRRLERVTIEAKGDGVHCSAGGGGSRLEVHEATVSAAGAATNRAIFSNGCQLLIADSDLVAVGGQTARALELQGSATVRASRLTVVGASSSNVAVRSANGDLALEDVEARGQQGVGGGSASALYLASATATVRASKLSTDSQAGAVLHADADSEARVTESLLSVGVLSVAVANSVSLDHTELFHVAYDGTPRCFAVYDEAFTNANGVEACP